MTAFNSCPQCNVMLQSFYLRSGVEEQLLEIDGCRRCGGTWFDAGELEKVLGQKLQLQYRAGNSMRLCARCRKPLKNWATKAGLALEQCEGCRGTFLDPGELLGLGAKEADASTKKALTPPGEFQCLKCQGRFPLSKGNAWGHGLVCRDCVPQPGEDIETLVPLPIANAAETVADGGHPLIAFFEMFFDAFFFRPGR